jgi:hypothetical protein
MTIPVSPATPLTVSATALLAGGIIVAPLTVNPVDDDSIMPRS